MQTTIRPMYGWGEGERVCRLYAGATPKSSMSASHARS